MSTAYKKILVLAGLALILVAGPVLAKSGLDYMESRQALNDIAQGIRYNKQGKNDLAIKRYSHAIESGRLDQENLAIAYNNRGNAWADKQDYKQAADDYGQAIKIKPVFVQAFFNRGIAHFRIKEYDKSFNDFSRTIAFEPNHAGAYFNRSFPLAQKGLYQQAMDDIKEALRLDPNNQKYAARLVKLRKLVEGR